VLQAKGVCCRYGAGGEVGGCEKEEKIVGGGKVVEMYGKRRQNSTR